MSALGELSLWVALVMAAWCTLLPLLGAALRRGDLTASGLRAALVTPPFLALALAGLASALLRGDFSLAFVAANGSANLPTVHRLTALWGAPAGALLVWSFALSVCAAMLALGRSTHGRSVAVLGVPLTAAVATLAISLRPFARLAWAPSDGTPGPPAFATLDAAFALPLLLAGLAAAAVPFALVAPALLVRRSGATDGEPGPARGWTLAAWMLLSLGLALAARRWGEGQSGTAGAAAAGAWLGATLLLHATTWRAVRWLVVATAAAALAPLALLPLMLAPAVGATWLPGVLGRLALAVGVLGAAGAAWELVRAARARDWSRLGAGVAHVGAAAIALSAGGAALSRDYEATLRTGQSLAARDAWGREWRFASDGLSEARRENYLATAVSLAAARGGRRVALLTGELRQYVDVRERPVAIPASVPGGRALPSQDIRLTLLDTAGEDEARVRVSFVPLAGWRWYGALAMVAGAVLAHWSARRRDRAGAPR